MKFLNDIKIMLFSNKVGEDEFGNMYYEQKKSSQGNRKKRYVRYFGEVESTKIPPMWHAWLHYTEKKLPRKNSWLMIGSINMVLIGLATFFVVSPFLESFDRLMIFAS